jgi:hypothetical protein
MSKIGSEALIANPALKDLETLVGLWQTTGTHPYFPDKTFHGQTSFGWIEGGAFLIMHSEIDEPEIPSGVAIFGSDDQEKKLYMLYFDERGVSRKYNLTIEEHGLTWWRDDPHFSQRMTTTIAPDGNTMKSEGEMSREGAAWEKDLALTFTRIK